MLSVISRIVHADAPLVIIETKPDFRFDADGGVTADVNPFWPRSSPYGVPASHTQLLDVNNDGVADYAILVRITYLDLDCNRMRSDGDQVRMRVERAEAVNPRMPLEVCRHVRRQAYEGARRKRLDGCRLRGLRERP